MKVPQVWLVDGPGLLSSAERILLNCRQINFLNVSQALAEYPPFNFPQVQVFRLLNSIRTPENLQHP